MMCEGIWKRSTAFAKIRFRHAKLHGLSTFVSSMLIALIVYVTRYGSPALAAIVGGLACVATGLLASS